MASSCCFQHFMCFLYSFHNYSKMQLSWFSANQHKEIITTVQEFLLHLLNILKFCIWMLRASSDQTQHLDCIYWGLCNPIGPYGGYFTLQETQVEGQKTCDLSVIQWSQMSFRPSHWGLDLSPGCDLVLHFSRNSVSVGLVSSWSWENPE